MDKLQFDVCRAGWAADYADPMTFLDMFVTGGGNNQTGWGNKEYDSLTEQVNKEPDPAKRVEIMYRTEKLLMEEMPIIPIYFYTTSVLMAPRVEGVVIPPFGVQAEFKWASLKK